MIEQLKEKKEKKPKKPEQTEKNQTTFYVIKMVITWMPGIKEYSFLDCKQANCFLWWCA